MGYEVSWKLKIHFSFHSFIYAFDSSEGSTKQLILATKD